MAVYIFGMIYIYVYIYIFLKLKQLYEALIHPYLYISMNIWYKKSQPKGHDASQHDPDPFKLSHSGWWQGQIFILCSPRILGHSHFDDHIFSKGLGMVQPPKTSHLRWIFFIWVFLVNQLGPQLSTPVRLGPFYPMQIHWNNKMVYAHRIPSLSNSHHWGGAAR